MFKTVEFMIICECEPTRVIKLRWSKSDKLLHGESYFFLTEKNNDLKKHSNHHTQ